MKKNIVIVHYNTPYLTECLVRSINLFVRDAVIYIFDNSDKQPFTAQFDNVKLLDNTAGQIIDFKKWLEKYPNKRKSGGRVNEWGSAKHCYSVEKCIELIGENLILLDSDVLLRKDISELFNDEYMYIGEEIIQPLSTIRRVLPFLCFINVDMCKKNGVHYFDENHMHGLYKSMEGDRYDTGASFYLEASKFKHKGISCDDYIFHYGHASWNKPGRKNPLSASEWLNKYRKYWTVDKNKKAIYTCITGGYDVLKDPKVITKGWDYVCFTDDTTMKSDVWNILPLPEESKGLSKVKKQRYVKINAHKVLPEYELSIWVDGNIDILGNLDKFVDSVLTDDISVYVPQHPQRKCIYSEAKIVMSMKKDTPENVEPQMKKYKEEGFPKDFGLLQSNILVRKHNEKDCVKLMEAWFEELKENSHRDQLSFNYVLWKNSDIHITYLDRRIYDSEWFKWRKVHGTRVSTAARELTTSNKVSRIHRNRDKFNALINNRRMQTHNVNIYQ